MNVAQVLAVLLMVLVICSVVWALLQDDPDLQDQMLVVTLAAAASTAFGILLLSDALAPY